VIVRSKYTAAKAAEMKVVNATPANGTPANGTPANGVKSGDEFLALEDIQTAL